MEWNGAEVTTCSTSSPVLPMLTVTTKGLPENRTFLRRACYTSRGRWSINLWWKHKSNEYRNGARLRRSLSHILLCRDSPWNGHLCISPWRWSARIKSNRHRFYCQHQLKHHLHPHRHQRHQHLPQHQLHQSLYPPSERARMISKRILRKICWKFSAAILIRRRRKLPTRSMIMRKTLLRATKERLLQSQIHPNVEKSKWHRSLLDRWICQQIITTHEMEHLEKSLLFHPDRSEHHHLDVQPAVRQSWDDRLSQDEHLRLATLTTKTTPLAAVHHPETAVDLNLVDLNLKATATQAAMAWRSWKKALTAPWIPLTTMPQLAHRHRHRHHRHQTHLDQCHYGNYMVRLADGQLLFGSNELTWTQLMITWKKKKLVALATTIDNHHWTLKCKINTH